MTQDDTLKQNPFRRGGWRLIKPYAITALLILASLTASAKGRQPLAEQLAAAGLIGLAISVSRTIYRILCRS